VYGGCHSHETYFTSLFINTLSHHQKCSHNSLFNVMELPLRLTLATTGSQSYTRKWWWQAHMRGYAHETLAIRESRYARSRKPPPSLLHFNFGADMASETPIIILVLIDAAEFFFKEMQRFDSKPAYKWMIYCSTKSPYIVQRSGKRCDMDSDVWTRCATYAKTTQEPPRGVNRTVLIFCG
jgi:hypothetical protein